MGENYHFQPFVTFSFRNIFVRGLFYFEGIKTPSEEKVLLLFVTMIFKNENPKIQGFRLPEYPDRSTLVRKVYVKTGFAIWGISVKNTPPPLLGT